MEKPHDPQSLKTAEKDDGRPKMRGRPLKEARDSATERHRARLRRSQVAFRQRKERHAIALEKKASGLAKVVEEMSTIFMDFSFDLLRTDHVDLELLKRTTERFSVLAQQATLESDQETGFLQEVTHGGNCVEADETRDSPKILINAGFPKFKKSSFSDSTLSLHETSSISSANQIQHSSFGYGIPTLTESRGLDPYASHVWGIPDRFSAKGTFVMPYILAGRDSFASHLYFETIVMAVRSLRGDGPREIMESFFRYALRYATATQILGGMTRIMNMLLHGTSQSSSEIYETVDISQSRARDERKAKAAIIEDVQSDGISETEYLDTWNVERYLRDTWSFQVDSMLVRTPPLVLMQELLYPTSNAFSNIARQSKFLNMSGSMIQCAPTVIPGFLHQKQGVFNVKSLVEKIATRAVSLGNGPRWHVSSIDSAVISFLGEIDTTVYS